MIYIFFGIYFGFSRPSIVNIFPDYYFFLIPFSNLGAYRLGGSNLLEIFR
jgi:hypothetical protein